MRGRPFGMKIVSSMFCFCVWFKFNLQQVASMRGYTCLSLCVDGAPNREGDIIRLLVHSRFDASEEVLRLINGTWALTCESAECHMSLGRWDHLCALLAQSHQVMSSQACCLGMPGYRGKNTHGGRYPSACHDQILPLQLRLHYVCC